MSHRKGESMKKAGMDAVIPQEAANVSSYGLIESISAGPDDRDDDEQYYEDCLTSANRGPARGEEWISKK